MGSDVCVEEELEVALALALGKLGKSFGSYT